MSFAPPSKLLRTVFDLAGAIDPGLTAERAVIRLRPLLDGLALGHSPVANLELVAAIALAALVAADRRDRLAGVPDLPGLNERRGG